MNLIHIRGGIGSQILRLFVGLMRESEEIKIVYNFSGYSKEQLDLIGRPSGYDIEYLQKLFDMSIPHEYMVLRGGVSKERIDSNTIKRVIDNRDKIVEKFSLKKIDHNLYPGVIHVRRRDSALVPDEVYNLVIKQNSGLNVITDDPLSVFKLKGDFNYSESEDEVEDWLRLTNTKGICIGPASMFTITAAYLNPELKVHLIHPSHYTNQVHGNDTKVNALLDLSQMFVENMENVNWYNFER